MNKEKNVIKLKFLKDGQARGRQYTYFSDIEVAVGDIVEIEAGTNKNGVITAINVPYSEIEPFKDRAKTIGKKAVDEIKIISFRVGKEPAFETIVNELETMQQLIGGNIEALDLKYDLVLICNEDGKCNGTPFNRALVDNNEIVDYICGDFFVCRASGGL